MGGVALDMYCSVQVQGDVVEHRGRAQASPQSIFASVSAQPLAGEQTKTVWQMSSTEVQSFS